MIKSLKEARIIDALPRIVAGQDWVIALSKALGIQHEKILQFADESQIYTELDSASESILDTLAVNWKVDWYDTSYTIEQKRRIIKTALAVRRLMGTVFATRLQADAIIPGTLLEEWFDYDGEPGTFRLYVNITDSEESPVTDYDMAEMERRLVTAKRWSAQLESLSYMIRHVIGIRLTVSRWEYSAPVCGVIQCGTYWMQATIGHSEEKAIQAAGTVNIYGYLSDVTGTVPETATQGSTVDAVVGYGTEEEIYVSAMTGSGQPVSGTVPETATQGGAVDAVVGYETEEEAYISEADLTGTVPETVTQGSTISAAVGYGTEEEAYTSETDLAGTLPETTTQGSTVDATVGCGTEGEAHVSAIAVSGLLYSGSQK